MPDTSILGRRVVREFTDLIAERGKPGMIVRNDGTELTSNAVFAWCWEIGGRVASHRPGQADTKRLRRELQRWHA